MIEYNSEDVKELLVRLNYMKAGGVHPSYGICSNVFLFTSESVQGVFSLWLESNIQRWPEFSGDPEYPVEGGSDEYWETEYKWSKTPNGDKRRRLLDWMIEELTKLVEHE